jgi:hypothetical protein
LKGVIGKYTMEEERKLTNEEKIAEQETLIKNITFFSDPIRFNSVIYSGLNSLLEKITKIEEILKKKEQELPSLPNSNGEN